MIRNALFVLLASTIACGAPRRKPTDNNGDPDGGCVTDAQCPDPVTQYCGNGVCLPRQTTGACTSHIDCAGAYCNILTGSCVECLNSDHCPLGEQCQSDGTCGTESGCVTNDDCGGLYCEQTNGNCVRCLQNEHCPPEQVCRDNACYTQGGGDPTCDDQSDCDPYGLICNTASGDCEPCDIVDQITGASNCAQGLVCTNGRCVPEGGGGGDGSCATIADCGGQACFIGYCMPCMMDEMCMDLMGGGVPKICQVDTGNCIDPECTTAAECPAGEGCYGGGHCGECLENAECRIGEICDEGVCGDCTETPQCTPGEECIEGVCTPPLPHTVELGGLCTEDEVCVEGLICLPGIDGSTCSRLCINSGRGGEADCPSGSACLSFPGTPYDGVLLCQVADQIDAGAPGQPFTIAPGDSCAGGNACQTGVCGGDDTCARMCVADRDCENGEVCRYQADPMDAEALSGERSCAPTDTTTRDPAGATCAVHDDCDSGLCMGGCASSGAPCDGFWDCLEDCVRTCREPCRSNSDCEDGLEACNPWPSVVGMLSMSNFAPVCLPKFGDGSTADGQSCSEYGDCASDWCEENICTTPCVLDEDCTGDLAGLSCTVRKHTDDAGAHIGTDAYCL